MDLLKDEQQGNVFEGKKLLTALEVGTRLRISLSTVHHLTRTGQIHSVKVGKQWRYFEEEVEHYLWGGYDFRKHAQERRKEDRRLYPRINCFIQGIADISNLDPQKKKWEGGGNALNISEGGMLFEIVYTEPFDALQFKIKDQVTLRLYFPSSVTPRVDGIDIEGQVARLDRDSQTRFGIIFQNLTPEASRIIQHYVNQC